MSKQEQVLVIEPANELRFRGPFTEVVTADLKLTNPSEKKVCFKVKTTAPKRYCVRPNSGFIDSKGSVSVSVMLQPFEYDPAEKNKHKFMVQTMYAPDGKMDNQEQLWKEATPDQLMDSKLKCVFEMPVAGDVSTSQSPGAVQEEKVKAVKQETVHTSRPDLPPVKQDPSPQKFQSAGNMDSPEKKQGDEVKRLEEKIVQLQRENQEVKNEGARLRKVAMSDTVSSTPAPSQRMESAPAPGLMLPSYAFLIIALILGIIIGKIIL